ncbi:hypothetical protein F5Y16DRAFT_370384 [Xylariaceae sp. FL0255]|nr:hypothetical protein F5Y16DRAFT_370384 [Xylariaceae sp. FL0255]
MARLTQGPIVASQRSLANPDSLTDLTRLLARLQQTILHADAERARRLRTSEYERNKAGINLEYARTLLTKLEQDALAIKVHTKRTELQADLNRRREIYEQLIERLREFEDTSIDSDDDSDEGEDLLGYIVPTPSQSSGEHPQDDIGDTHQEQEEEDDEGESTVLPEKDTTKPSSSRQRDSAASSSHTRPPEPPPATRRTTSSTTTPPTLRPRRSTRASTAASAATDTATTTGTSTGAAAATAPTTTTTALRTQLFGNANANANTSSGTTATTEAIMDSQRAEQDKLTESMVSMAVSLKDMSYAFSSALDRDKEVLENAGKGLERNEQGLGSAAGRMLNLRRLTEGKGWWGRMLLYAWIAGLSVFAVLLVFVFPKLRF